MLSYIICCFDSVIKLLSEFSVYLHVEEKYTMKYYVDNGSQIQSSKVPAVS